MTVATDRPHGLSFIQVRHDPWCRVPDTQRASDCTCNAEAFEVTQAVFVEGLNRAARREAARAARRGRKS